MTTIATVEKVFDDGVWLTAVEINSLQKRPPKLGALLASEWERFGRVFSVFYNGKKYYARYQFDTLYQPLPIIKRVLDTYGVYEDAWSVAAWFYFPNGWITEEGPAGITAVSPKNVLHRCDELINAAGKRRGTYTA